MHVKLEAMSLKYDQLDSARSEIRLLFILPGLHDDEIHASLHTLSLNDHLQFEALSYTWGPKDKLRSIVVNDAKFEIRPNLQAALRHLCLPDRERAL